MVTSLMKYIVTEKPLGELLLKYSYPSALMMLKWFTVVITHFFLLRCGEFTTAHTKHFHTTRMIETQQ